MSHKSYIPEEEELDRTRGPTSKINPPGQYGTKINNWIGHVPRGDGLLRDVLEGGMLGKRPRGSPRRGMIDDLMKGSFTKMKRRAEGRKEWRDWVPGTCLRAEHL